MIELKNISFSYANNCEDSQLRHIDLTVKKGELIILAGKSGCGKTTLTRVLNGLCPQFYPGKLTGGYSLDGQDALKIPIHQLGTMEVYSKTRAANFLLLIRPTRLRWAWRIFHWRALSCGNG